MNKQKMTLEIMEFVVWVIEISAKEFFNGDKTTAYDVLKNTDLWDVYVDYYDVSHTLSADYILEEMREYFTKNGVTYSC